MSAKEYKSKSIVSGMKVGDILNMRGQDVVSLNLSDLRKVVGRLVSAGNKRIRRLEKAGLTPPALGRVKRSGGAFSTKGKTLNDLRAEFVRAREFLKSGQSTVSGYKKQLKETEKRFKERGIDVVPGTVGKLFSIYERLKETNPEISSRAFKYTALKSIANEIRIESGKTTDEILSDMRDELRRQYEMNEDIDQDVSDFFGPIDDDEDF